MKSFKTKFGTAYVTSRGYVKICSVKEGNENKLLHRLVFEDFYNVKLPSNIIIHHNDKNQIRYLRANSIEDLEKRVKKRGWRWEKLT